MSLAAALRVDFELTKDTALGPKPWKQTLSDSKPQAAALVEGKLTEHMAADRAADVKTFHVWLTVRRTGRVEGVDHFEIIPPTVCAALLRGHCA